MERGTRSFRALVVSTPRIVGLLETVAANPRWTLRLGSVSLRIRGGARSRSRQWVRGAIRGAVPTCRSSVDRSAKCSPRCSTSTGDDQPEAGRVDLSLVPSSRHSHACCYRAVGRCPALCSWRQSAAGSSYRCSHDDSVPAGWGQPCLCLGLWPRCSPARPPQQTLRTDRAQRATAWKRRPRREHRPRFGSCRSVSNCRTPQPAPARQRVTISPSRRADPSTDQALSPLLSIPRYRRARPTTLEQGFTRRPRATHKSTSPAKARFAASTSMIRPGCSCHASFRFKTRSRSGMT